MLHEQSRQQHESFVRPIPSERRPRLLADIARLLDADYGEPPQSRQPTIFLCSADALLAPGAEGSFHTHQHVAEAGYCHDDAPSSEVVAFRLVLQTSGGATMGDYASLNRPFEIKSQPDKSAVIILHDLRFGPIEFAHCPTHHGPTPAPLLHETHHEHVVSHGLVP